MNSITEETPAKKKTVTNPHQESDNTKICHKLASYNVTGPEFCLLLHMPSNQITRYVWSVHCYTDNCGLFPTGPYLQLSIINFYTLLIPMGNKRHFRRLNRHRVTPSNKVLTQTWSNHQRRQNPHQASPGCNMLNIIFFMLLKTFWIPPTLTSTHNTPSQ